MNNICIDLGGTNIKAGLIAEQELVYSCSSASHSDESFNSVILNLEGVINQILSQTGFELSQIQGIGLSMPGIINVDRNKVIAIKAKYEQAINFDFNQWSRHTFKLPFVMENDARAALVGEWQNGQGKGYNDIVMITLGTGVGGAALINGKLLYGKHYQAGCLGGHLSINYKGSACNCGNIGCVEAEASSWRLRKLVEEQEGGAEFLKKTDEDFNYKMLFEQKRAGDELASRIVEHNLKVWAAGIVNLVHAYDPEIVILSGGIMKSKDDILPFIEKWVKQYAWTPMHEPIVKASTEMENIALWGINYLLNQKLEAN